MYGADTKPNDPSPNSPIWDIGNTSARITSKDGSSWPGGSFLRLLGFDGCFPLFFESAWKWMLVGSMERNSCSSQSPSQLLGSRYPNGTRSCKRTRIQKIFIAGCAYCFQRWVVSIGRISRSVGMYGGCAPVSRHINAHRETGSLRQLSVHIHGAKFSKLILSECQGKSKKITNVHNLSSSFVI